MSKSLSDWIKDDVAPVRSRDAQWLSEYFFFRDPARPAYHDLSFFFAPADGVVLYSKIVDAAEPLVEIKGRSYSLQEAMRDETYRSRSLVIGIFMTFFDVHTNRVPYPGYLSYTFLNSVLTYNSPMLEMEEGIIDELALPWAEAVYLMNNQRVLNRVFSPHLQQWYYILQIADYDVRRITPFEVRQNMPFRQNIRFSAIRYGSQVDLIVPVSDAFDFELLVEPSTHVQAGLDPIIRVLKA